MADHGLSQRRAARLVGVDPKTIRRKRLPDNPEVRKKMRDLAAKRRRFGYRRLGVLLVREGYDMNPKKLFRLYKEEGLTVRRRKSRKGRWGAEVRCPHPIGQETDGL